MEIMQKEALDTKMSVDVVYSWIHPWMLADELQLPSCISLMYLFCICSVPVYHVQHRRDSTEDFGS